MKYVGVDLTSAFSARPRAVDVAVIHGNGGLARPAVSFHQVHWPAAAVVEARDVRLLHVMLRGPLAEGDEAVFAVDGPQGLAAIGVGRACELQLGTPGRTPDALPATDDGGPFQTYIRSSVDLFHALVRSPVTLAGLNGAGKVDATLYEVFPGAEWAVLAGRRLARKATDLGRRQRRDVFDCVLRLPPEPVLPSADQLDALAGAYLAWCTRNRPNAVVLVGRDPFTAGGELREGTILHAVGPSPCKGQVPADAPEPVEAVPADRPPVATPDEEEWVDDRAVRLCLSDYGAVHGGTPENDWMRPRHDYVCRTLPPGTVTRFTLERVLNFGSDCAVQLAWQGGRTRATCRTRSGTSSPRT